MSIIQNLPSLRGAGSGESRIDPTLRPYLELGLQRGEQLFFGPPPSFFAGQTYVDPSQQTLDALLQQEQLATAPSVPLQQAQQAYLSGMQNLGQIAGGSFLGANPFRDEMISAATRPLQQQFEQSTLPALQSAFSRAGRYGSGAQTRAIGQAQEATTRAMGDITASISAQDFARERQLQQQAIGQQMAAAQLAPQFYQQQFMPSQQLAQIGAAREQISGLPLQEQLSRFQFEQQAPYTQLQNFLSGVYGTPMASSQIPQPQQAQSNRVGSALGGAALGYGVGQMIGGSYGGFSSPVIGAGIGALAGGFL